MKLMTTLLKTKQELNGGTVPFPPLTPGALELIDPAFQGLGPKGAMGFIWEDAEKGMLRCPARGCGRYQRDLGTHWRHRHGGSQRLRAALDIPGTAPLISAAASEKRREMGRTTAYILKDPKIQRKSRAARRRSQKATNWGKFKSALLATVGARNVRNRCEAQIHQRLLDLKQRLGRMPRADEDTSLAGAMERYYGGWNAGLAHFGEATRGVGAPKGRGEITPQVVLESLEAWAQRHGRLPTFAEAYRGDSLPYVPSYSVVLRALRAKTWPTAMAAAAEFLGVLPPKVMTRAECGRKGMAKRLGRAA